MYIFSKFNAYNMNTHTHMHNTHTHMHASTHNMHTCMHTHTHSHMHTHTHTRVHARTHTCRVTYQDSGTEEKFFLKRKVFKKELTEVE